MKRIYWQTIKKNALKASIPLGVAGFALLFWYLSLVGAITVTGFTGDQICAGTIDNPCIAIINFTENEDIFLYPLGYDPYGRNTPFTTDAELESWKMYRSWGKGWREIKLNDTCQQKWCGAPYNNMKDNKYSFAFREGRNYTIKIEALKKDPYDDVKWGFGDVDPIFYGKDEYKQYDESSKKVTLRDKNFNNISEITLDTPPDFIVPRGYQKIAEYTKKVNDTNVTIGLFTEVQKGDVVEWIPTFNFDDVIGDLNIESVELINKKTGGRINRNIDVKIKKIDKVMVDDYVLVCEEVFNQINQTNQTECTKNITGYHFIDKISWEDANFTSTKGIKIKVGEWAIWTEALSSGLVAYFALDSSTGTTAYDGLEIHDSPIANIGDEDWVTGVLGNALDFDGDGDAELINLSTVGAALDGVNALTISYWVNYSEVATVQSTFSFGAGGTPQLGLQRDSGRLNSYGKGICNNGWGSTDGGSSIVAVGVLYHYVLVENTTGIYFYVNGSFIQARACDTTGTFDGTVDYAVLGTREGYAEHLDGLLDEVGIWNRSLTSSEITELYNNGIGITYGVNPPTSTLNNPIDNQNFTTGSITFSVTPKDVEDTSGLGVNLYGNWSGSWAKNSSNASAYNNTQTNFSVTGISDGIYIWNAEVNDTADLIGWGAANFTFTIDTVNPAVAYDATTESDGAYLSRDYVLVNISTTDTNLHSVRLNWDGTNETFATNVGNNYWENKTSLSEGNYTFYGWGNDSVGHYNLTSEREILIDTVKPLISFIASTKANASIQTSSVDWVFANVSITETNRDYTTFTLFNSSKLVNETVYTGNVNSINWTGLPLGTYIYNVTVNDSAGNENSTETYYIYSTTFTIFLNYADANISAELNSSFNIVANSTVNLTICVDIDHPNYGINYSCGYTERDFNASINYFRNTTFNDLTSSKSFYYDAGLRVDNLTISSHQYDEVDGLSFNISGGTNNPLNMIFFHANSTPVASNQSSLELYMDRFFHGNLVGDLIYMSEFFDNTVVANLTFSNAGEQLKYISIDDILNTSSPTYTFFFNITGQLFGMDYTEGNNTVGYLGFDDYDNISATETDMELDISGVIMPKNITEAFYYYDDFEDNELNQSLWVNTSCTYAGINPHECIVEKGGVMELGAEISEAQGIFGGTVASLDLDRFESDTINFSIYTNWTGERIDGFSAGTQTKHIRFGGATPIWTQYALPIFDDVGFAGANASLNFSLTKINRTYWSSRIWGTENAYADGNPSSPGTKMWTGSESVIVVNSSVLTFYNDVNTRGGSSGNSTLTVEVVNHTLWTRENSTVISESIYDSSGDIADATFWIVNGSAGGESLTYYLSADDGENWEAVASGVQHAFSDSGTHLKWRVDVNITGTDNVNSASQIYKINISVPSGWPSNIEVDFGDDGTVDYTYSGELNSTNSPQEVNLSFVDITSAFVSTNQFAQDYTYDHTYKIPFSVSTDTIGQVDIDSVNLTYSPNPVELNTTLITQLLTDSTNSTTFMIPFFSGNSSEGSNASLTIEDMRYDFAGGKDEIIITLHDSLYKLNLTRSVTNYYSRWDYNITPNYTNYVEFIPSTPTSLNVTPFGQTSTVPILNLSNLGYEKNTDLYLKVGSTFGCINFTAYTNSSIVYGYNLNTSWLNFSNNINYLGTTDIYLWADYACSGRANFTLFQPSLYVRQSCVGCLSSEDI